MAVAKIGVFNANVESKGSPPIGGVLDDRTPPVLVITEAYNCRAYLKDCCEEYGYDLYQYGDNYGEEGSDVAVMVRDSFTVAKCDPMCMDEPWWGPKTGKKREPRVYPRLLIEDPDLPGDLKWKIVAVHFPPGGPKGGTSSTLHGKNKAAWMESRDRTIEYGNGHPEGPYLIVGDVNATHDECAAQFNERLDGPTCVRDLGKVDHLIGRRVEVETDRIDAPVGHGWGVFHVTSTET